jgi:hypothetical protein
MSDDMPKRIEVIFQDATHNLRFFKQQEWTVTNYALAAYAALFAVAHIAKQAGPPLRVIVIAAIVLVAAYSIAILLSFVDSLEKFRGRIEWIYKKYFECEEREALGLGARKGLSTESDSLRALLWFRSRVPSSRLSPCGTIYNAGHDIPR